MALLLLVLYYKECTLHSNSIALCVRVANRVHSLLADQAENNGQKIFNYQLLILFGTCFEFVVGIKRTKQYLLFWETKYLLMKKINDFRKLKMEIYKFHF